jgi:hypothetical protein
MQSITLFYLLRILLLGAIDKGGEHNMGFHLLREVTFRVLQQVSA